MTSYQTALHFTADYPEGTLRRMHRQGQLRRVRPGAYSAATELSDTRAQTLAHCLAIARKLRVRFAFSHQTAAILHGLPVPTPPPKTMHLIQATTRSGTNASDLTRHVVSCLPDEDISEVHGLPVTTLERTCLDNARSLRPSPGMAIADATLRKLAGTNRFEWPATAEHEDRLRELLLDRLRMLGAVRGVVRARAVVAHADGRAESAPESSLRCRVLARGFCPPEPQVRVETTEGAFYPDLLWSTAAVHSGWGAIALEYDGAVKYESRHDLYREKLREDALRASGCLVMRATKSDIHDSGRLIAQLGRHVRVDTEAGRRRRGLRALR